MRTGAARALHIRYPFSQPLTCSPPRLLLPPGSARLRENPQLVYALLQRQALFVPRHAQHHAQPDELRAALEGLAGVVRFFAPRVLSIAAAASRAGSPVGPADHTLPTTAQEAAAEAEGAARTADEAMAALEAAASEWDPALLPPVAALRFSYEQEPDAEEFFTPYMWAVVCGTVGVVDAGGEEDGAPPLGASQPEGSPSPIPPSPKPPPVGSAGSRSRDDVASSVCA